MSLKPNIFYHYTTWTAIEEIIQSGSLNVSHWERKQKIKKPALWLTTSSTYEPTAVKPVRDGFGNIHELTFAEMYLQFGAGRILLPKLEGIITWAKYKYSGCCDVRTYEGLAQRGIDQGANPADWFILFKNVPSSDWIGIEKWNGEEWITFEA